MGESVVCVRCTLYKYKGENCIAQRLQYICNYIVRVIRVGKGENHNRMTDSNWVSSSGGFT